MHQQCLGNFPTAGHPHPRAHEEVIAEEQQNQQQAFLRLFGGHNPFQTAQQLAANDAAVSQVLQSNPLKLLYLKIPGNVSTVGSTTILGCFWPTTS